MIMMMVIIINPSSYLLTYLLRQMSVTLGQTTANNCSLHVVESASDYSF